MAGKKNNGVVAVISDFSENISVLTAYIYLRIVMRSMSPKIHMSGVRME